jgi:hypothetical protein
MSECEGKGSHLIFTLERDARKNFLRACVEAMNVVDDDDDENVGVGWTVE